MRIVRIALILFLTFFLNVFLPGHTRGAITLNGPKDSCCQTPEIPKDVPSCCASKQSNSPKKTPTSEDRKCCAVCYIAAIYLPVEPLYNELKLHESIELAHDLAVAQVRSIDYPTPFWSTAPPSL